MPRTVGGAPPASLAPLVSLPTDELCFMVVLSCCGRVRCCCVLDKHNSSGNPSPRKPTLFPTLRCCYGVCVFLLDEVPRCTRSSEQSRTFSRVMVRLRGHQAVLRVLRVRRFSLRATEYCSFRDLSRHATAQGPISDVVSPVCTCLDFSTAFAAVNSCRSCLMPSCCGH